MRWHRWEPLHRGGAHEGARLAFGRTVDPVLRLDRADVVLAIESDMLTAAPGHLAYARAFAERRAPERGEIAGRCCVSTRSRRRRR
jgi:molybdopterin-containing oxidoreductase family iron-sulfur binding subunit